MPDIAQFGTIATRALLTELATTPKPGLVDRNGNGAHRDLSYARLEASALSLEPIFSEIARSAKNETPSVALREHLGDIGRRGERAMLVASGGTNTHRGAIWALGLLVAGAVGKGENSAKMIASRAGALARTPDRFTVPTTSHGRVVSMKYDVGGARSEAESAFPHVVDIAFPAVRAAIALPDVFLRLVATVSDTCVLHRGGRRAHEIAQRGARQALRSGGSLTPEGARSIRELELALISRNASPGGCADLLAAAILLDDIAD